MHVNKRERNKNVCQTNSYLLILAKLALICICYFLSQMQMKRRINGWLSISITWQFSSIVLGEFSTIHCMVTISLTLCNLLKMWYNSTCSMSDVFWGLLYIWPDPIRSWINQGIWQCSRWCLTSAVFSFYRVDLAGNKQFYFYILLKAHSHRAYASQHITRAHSITSVYTLSGWCMDAFVLSFSFDLYADEIVSFIRFRSFFSSTTSSTDKLRRINSFIDNNDENKQQNMNEGIYGELLFVKCQ